MKFSLEQLFLLDIMKYLCDEKYELNKEYLEQVDWVKLLELANEHSLVLPIYKKLNKIIDSKAKDLWKNKYCEALQRLTILLSQADKICQKVKVSGIKALIQKGFSFSYYIYNDLYSRQFGDIDFLVSEDDIFKMDSILKEDGYYEEYDKLDGQYEHLPTPQYKNTDHHELYDYVQIIEGKLICVEAARFLHDYITREHINSFLSNTVMININGMCFEMMDMQHSFLCLIENTYTNTYSIRTQPYTGSSKLRDYMDIYQFIVKYINTETELSKIVSLAKKYNIEYLLITVLGELMILFWNDANLEHIYKYICDNIIYKSKDEFLSVLYDNERSYTISYYEKLINSVYDDLTPRVQLIEQNYSEYGSLKVKLFKNGDRLIIRYYIQDINNIDDLGIKLMLMNNKYACAENDIFLYYQDNSFRCLLEKMAFVNSHSYTNPPRRLQDWIEDIWVKKEGDIVEIRVAIPYEQLGWNAEIDINEIGFHLIIRKKIYNELFHDIISYPKNIYYYTYKYAVCYIYDSIQKEKQNVLDIT